LRYYGLVPMLQWIMTLEKTGAPTKTLLTLQRLQNLLNVMYYPLEHTWWLGSHQVIPIEKATLNKIGLWSCRFWATAIILSFFQLYEEYKLLKQRQEVILAQISKGSLSPDEVRKKHAEIAAEKKRLVLETIINSAYLPLTVHWSSVNSKFPDIGVGICGTIASMAQLYNAWRSTA